MSQGFSDYRLRRFTTGGLGAIVWPMAILKIARMGHPVLADTAELVDDPKAPEIRHLIADMLDTMDDAAGAGLAAPQVHVPLRVVIFHVPQSRSDAGEDEDEAVALTILINPEIEVLDDTLSYGMEGCLSVPGLMGEVPRYNRIRYRGFDPFGNEFQCEASGFHARVVQHECDHLDGILYPMRMTDLSTLTFTSELGRSTLDEEDDDDELSVPTSNDE